MKKTLSPQKRILSGVFSPPPDKSISHRASLLAAIAHGRSRLSNLSASEDCRSTLSVLRALGVSIYEEGSTLWVEGRGREAFVAPSTPLDCGNSGTTVRLLCGILASIPGMRATLMGDSSLQKRPMRRIAEPLRQMGAKISGDTLPFTIEGASLQGISWHDEKSSAQVKSALLLAGLAAEGKTLYQSPYTSRAHTETMLAWLGAPPVPISYGYAIEKKTLLARDLVIPGDPSGAAFFLAAAAALPGSSLCAEEVLLSPERTAFAKVLRQMGANVVSQSETSDSFEPCGTLNVSAGELHGVTLSGAQIPLLIDELPLLAVIATQAQGTTVVQDARELRVKESDRIETIVTALQAMGANIVAKDDGFVVQGPCRLHGAYVESHGDHRIAMSCAIAALFADGPVEIEDAGCVAVSYPNFFETYAALVGEH